MPGVVEFGQAYCTKHLQAKKKFQSIKKVSQMYRQAQVEGKWLGDSGDLSEQALYFHESITVCAETERVYLQGETLRGQGLWEVN